MLFNLSIFLLFTSKISFDIIKKENVEFLLELTNIEVITVARYGT